MAKSVQRNLAIKLRQSGKSIKDIAKILKVSKSSASKWCENVILTSEQIDRLHENMVKSGHIGRIKGSRMQYEDRIRRMQEAEEVAMREVGALSQRDLLIALTALYWGEGSKRNRILFISNSDPEMINFLLNAFKKIFQVTNDSFTLAIGLNVIHKDREQEIKDYWVKVTGIPKEQFRKTIFIKTRNKKSYSNFNNHYGTLRVNIRKSTSIYYKMMGFIKALRCGY